MKIPSKTIAITIPFAALLALAGCAENFKTASPNNIAQAVVQTPTQNGPSWSGPTLHSSHLRKQFFGDDTLAYRLTTSPDETGTQYHLMIDTDYGGNLRHYGSATLPDQSTHQIHQLDHLTQRCQLFSDLTPACLYHDSLSVDLTEKELEKGRDTGMKIQLSTGKHQTETLELPANYIQGVLLVTEHTNN